VISRQVEATAASVSAGLAALGPFFGAEFHDGSALPEASWRSMGELLENPEVLNQRVAFVRGSLAERAGLAVDAIEPRVAASVAHLGLLARLTAPLFALALVHRRAMAIGLRDLRWRPLEGTAFDVSIPVDLLAASDVPATTMLDGDAVTEVGEAFSRFGISRQILSGNAASALAGAATALSLTRTDLAESARAMLAGLLTHPTLRDAARLEPSGTLRRRSCCLIYRAAPGANGALCGDCVLVPRRDQRLAELLGPQSPAAIRLTKP